MVLRNWSPIEFESNYDEEIYLYYIFTPSLLYINIFTN